MEVFAPLNETKTERLSIDVSKIETLSGSLKTRGRGKKARIRVDGRIYDVYGKSCGMAGCMCDAYVKEVKPARS